MTEKKESSASKIVTDVGVVEANGPVICTICLDEVEERSPRSSVTLHCTHRFHLDCIGSFFNFKRCMECPNCRELQIGKWVCSKSYDPSGDESMLEGLDLSNLNITVTPFASVWDSLDEPPLFQPSPDSSSGTLPVGTEPAEGVPAELGVPTPAAIPRANGSLLFSQETDDLHVQANVLEHYRELYPGLYRTVMTIQRVSAAVGRGSNGQEGTDESIWAEPSFFPQAGEETAESIWAQPSLPREAGNGDEQTDESVWAVPSPPPASQ